MVTDIYYDCPLCSHTMVLDPSWVGKWVECPNCRNEVRVPDIREGLNPRFRGEEVLRARTPASATDPTQALEGRLDLLAENLESLLRRREEQARQMEYIRFNAELGVRQIRLLRESSAPEEEPVSVAAPAAPAPSAVAGDRYLTWSLVLACVTLVLGVALLILLFPGS